MIQLNHRHQVVQRLHCVRLWHGGEVVAQLSVRGRPVARDQAVVSVAPDDGVQVEAVGLLVAVEQAAGEQVVQVAFKDLRGLGPLRFASGVFEDLGGLLQRT